MTPTSTSPSVRIRSDGFPCRTFPNRLKSKRTAEDRKRRDDRAKELRKFKATFPSKEAWREWLAADKKAHPEKYYRTGVPDGMRKHQADKLRAACRAKATEFMAMIGEPIDPTIEIPDTDEGKARAALHELAVIALFPGDMKTKVTALNALLSYTKEKPVTKGETTLNAGDWLKAAVEASKK